MLCKGYFKLSDELKYNKNEITISSRKALPLNNVSFKNHLTYCFGSSFYYIVAFFIFNISYYNTLYLQGTSLNIFAIYLLSVALGILISKKFDYRDNIIYNHVLTKIYLSLFISLLSLTLLLNLFHLSNAPRIPILLILFTGLILEAYYYLLNYKKSKDEISFFQNRKLSVKYLLLDGIILAFFIDYWIFTDHFIWSTESKDFILVILLFISWLVSAATTHKFIPNIVSISRWNALELQFKFYMRIISLGILSAIFLNLDYPQIIDYTKALVAYSSLSAIISMFLFAKKIKNKTDEPAVVFLKAYEMSDAEIASKPRNGNSKYSYSNTLLNEVRVQNKLQFEFLKEYGYVFSILDTMLDLSSFDTRKSVIIKSDASNTPSLLPDNSYQLFVNLHILNDQIKLNDYLRDVRKTLTDGGVFVGAFIPHHYRYRQFLKKYSFWLANIYYLFDFIWKRVFPKLPLTREFYFTFNKEKDRTISLAEGLGRLVYCGFKILDLAAVNDVVYFAALKDKEPENVKKFFYSPIFKMRRIGKGGKTIYVYKLRTMYPYSEYIQDFVYAHNNLDVGGKFKDDFRVPSWGKLFRRLWIDELPMLINMIKGDLKLVGVRPVSNHYLSLYSKEHQQKRKEFKPGLIPPFYADMPKTIEEIELSEKRYFQSFEKNPFMTDVKYFIKAMNNILIKKKRSS